MKPLSALLTILIAEAEVVIRLPQAVPQRATDAFHLLAAEIRHVDGQPAEGLRATRAAIIMLSAMEGWFETGGEKGNPWLMLAGATLPLLRVDAWRALQNEREASKS